MKEDQAPLVATICDLYTRRRFHDLRHTCAALLIVEGPIPKVIRLRLGHASITVTLDRYGHLFRRWMRRYGAPG